MSALVARMARRVPPLDAGGHAAMRFSGLFHLARLGVAPGLEEEPDRAPACQRQERPATTRPAPPLSPRAWFTGLPRTRGRGRTQRSERTPHHGVARTRPLRLARE